MTPPEVAYFKYMRDYHARFDPESEGYKYGRVLRPDVYSPNYEFFVPNLVCWKHDRPIVRWGSNYNKWTTEISEDLAGFTCVNCGLLDPVSFKKCPYCQGAFYNLFRHPYQVKTYPHCWNCLESGSSTQLHDWYRRYTKLAPPENLIPPVVTSEMLQAGEDMFWDKLNNLLKD